MKYNRNIIKIQLHIYIYYNISEYGVERNVPLNGLKSEEINERLKQLVSSKP